MSKDGKHIIYSISWHPKESKIALVGSLGYCMVYDALKSKCLGMLQPESVPSFKVDWNPIDPSLILMGSQNNKCIVINAQNVKDLQI